MTKTVNAANPAEFAWDDPSHKAWLALSARFGRFVATVADRTDLIARVAPGDEALPIACFVPALAEVHFTANKIWQRDVDPDTVDPNDGLDRARHPQMVGAACHEAAHAAHTRLSLPDNTDPAAAHWAVLLEEPRIEAALIARRPADRVWLRAAAIQLCADGSLARDAQRDTISRYQAGRTAVLFLGRVAAGVLTDSETVELRDEVTDVLGPETMTEVDSVLGEAVTVADGDTEALLTLGARLAAVITEDTPDHAEDGQGKDEQGDGTAGQPEAAGGTGSTPDDGDQDDSNQNSQGSGQNSDDQGSDDQGSDGQDGNSQESNAEDSGQGGAATSDQGTGSDGKDGSTDQGVAHQLPCGSWTTGDLPDGINPWAADADDADRDSAPNDSGDPPALIDAIRATADQVSQDADRKAKAAAFTNPPRDPNQQAKEHERRATVAAAAAVFGTHAAPIVVSERQPDAALHEQARRLTWALRRAQFRAITRTTTPATAPPGRMRMGEVMRRDAQKAARARITAQPWRQTHRRETPQPPLTVGFSGDVSGSMDPWQAVTANLSWAVAHAISHMAGRVAAVAWNTNVAPVIHPGETPPLVREAACDGGSRGCALSLRSLDGALKLSANTEGARVAVVVTDGQLGDTYDSINREVQRLTRAGVKVLWVTPTPDRRIIPAATNLVLHDPNAFGETIGTALADLLSQA